MNDLPILSVTPKLTEDVSSQIQKIYGYKVDLPEVADFCNAIFEKVKSQGGELIYSYAVYFMAFHYDQFIGRK